MKGAAYQCLYNGPGQFIVIKRWVTKDNKPHRFDYEVAYKKGRWMCDPKCKGFTMSPSKDKEGKPIKKKDCIHIKFAKMCMERPELMKQVDDFDWLMHLKHKEVKAWA